MRQGLELATIDDIWREQITGLADAASFSDGVTDDEITLAEQALGGQLPRPLVELLHETDGVTGEYGLALIWPLARIVEDNLLFRTNPEFR